MISENPIYKFHALTSTIPKYFTGKDVDLINAEKWTFKNLIFVKFDEVTKLGKAFKDSYNYGRF